MSLEFEECFEQNKNKKNPAIIFVLEIIRPTEINFEEKSVQGR